MICTQIKCCGSGSPGLLFQAQNKDYSSLQTIVFPFDLKLISTSGTISCAISGDSSLYIWKSNVFRLLKTQVVQVACGWTHVLIRTSSDVFVYGQGNQGQLGLGEIKESLNPTSLGISSSTSISCGFRTSFIVLSRSFLAFGENSSYQLGFGTKDQVKTPTENSNLDGLQDIRSGNKHSLGFCRNRLFVWGSNTFGQLGKTEKVVKKPEFIDFKHEIKKVCCGWNHSVLLMEDGKVFVAGKGDLGQQGNGENKNCFDFHKVLEGIEDIESATESVFALERGKVYAWGWNEHGNLGVGDYVDRNEPVFVMDGVNRICCGGAVSYFQ